MDNAPPTTNPLDQFVARLRAERDYWSRQSWDPPPEPPAGPMPERYKLEFRPGFSASQPTVSLDQARKDLKEKLWSYALEKRPNRILLVRAQPGLGKTHAAVSLAQDLADLQNLRTLYAMPTHKHFETISSFPHFAPHHWYHWLATDAESPDTGNTMCQYPLEMVAWNQKGYPAMKLCDSLCPLYKENCEYRRQTWRPERIVAGVHNHVSLGLSISDFYLTVVDELPLGAFLRPRHIPKEGVLLKGAGPVVDLSLRLMALIEGAEHPVKGKALLDEIGPLLADVYAQVDDYESALPVIPWVSRPDDVDRAAWWYLPDLLTPLVQEWKAWEAGAAHWLERVILTKHGMDLLQRADPWDGLPARLVVLDATGSGAIYRQLFSDPGKPRNVEVFEPNVERLGKVYQVVNRLHGIGTFLEGMPEDGEEDEKPKRKKRLSKQGLAALELCKAIVEANGYQNPGAITYKGAAPEFEAFFGAGRVLWFHGPMRGSNDLIDCDVIFVVGAPQPKDSDLMRAVTALYPRRTKPFNLVDAAGWLKPARGEEMRAYNYFDERGQAWRMVSGFWSDQDLNTMADVLREQELVQAIHRGRPITREVDVYLLTSIPTDERLTGIYENPGELLGVPGGISNWQAWMKLGPWLKERHGQGLPVTYGDIAEATGLPETTIRRWKWLDAILEKYPEYWQADQIAPGGRKPRRAISPM